MKLGVLVATENYVSVDSILLLRHASDAIKKLRKCSATIEEFSAIQPNGTDYDYLLPGKPPIEIVVVIVDALVYAVFRVLGVDGEGTNRTLASPEYRLFDVMRGKVEQPARKYRLGRVESVAEGQLVTGWEGRQRTAVQRSAGGFFNEVEVPVAAKITRAEQAHIAFESALDLAYRSSEAERRGRISAGPAVPQRVEVLTTVFLRNEGVAAETLVRAKGECGRCGKAAPFVTKSGRPYLEVHHKVPLAAGGEDTIENTIAVCPNCHRLLHYA